MRARLSDERGTALFTAIILLTVMLTFGLAVVALSDEQERQSGTERVKEASMGVAEAALEAQVARLSRTWPLTAAGAYPAECSPGAGALTFCPDTAALSTALNAPDNANTACAAPDWRTQVRDNGAPITGAYRTSVAATQPAWDANGDGLVWVRAEGSARCRVRTLVTLVRVGQRAVSVPRMTVAANWFWTNNQGRKVIVDTVGPTRSGAAPVMVRCTAPTPTPCLKVDTARGQVAGSTPSQSVFPSSTFTPDQVTALKAFAKVYTGGSAAACPPNLNGIIFVENMDGCPSYSGGNSSGAPGVLYIGKGGLSLTGNRIFYGLIYALNGDGRQSALVQVQGAALIQGAVAVDGLGGVIAGASSMNIVFDPRAFALVKALGDASQVPGTWRELATGE